MCQTEADIFQKRAVSKAVFVLSGVHIPKQHSCIETAEPQSSGAWLFSWEGPWSTPEKPLKIPRVFPTAVMDVHAVMELCYTHRAHCIASSSWHAWSPDLCVLLWGSEPWGPGGKGHRLLSATPAKGKPGWMGDEGLDSELWNSLSQLSLTLGSVRNWPDLLCARWQNH